MGFLQEFRGIWGLIPTKFLLRLTLAVVLKVRHAQNGFTRIELLIAIFATQAAILFPVFAQVRESASSCLPSARQIRLVGVMYAQGWDETVPEAGQYLHFLRNNRSRLPSINLHATSFRQEGCLAV